MLKKIVKKIVDFYLNSGIFEKKDPLSQDDLLFENLLLQKKFRKLPEDAKINILKVYKNTNWEDINLLPALKSFGNVTEYPMDEINCYSLSWLLYKKKKFNKRFLKELKEIIIGQKIDLIFFYVSALIISPATIREIEKIEIPTVNISLDDRLKFKAYPIPGGYAGVHDICPYFTINVTTVKERLKDYYRQKAFCLFLPPAGNEKIFRNIDLIKDIEVSFIGQNYGNRESTIRYLKENDIPIQAYGKGFEGGFLTIERMINIYNRSKITIGFSEVLDSDQPILKGRDFEVGLCGVFYLTSYNHDLAELFTEGKEIEFYRNKEELIDKIKFYLDNEEKREKIALQFRQKCLENHTWVKRFKEIFSYLQ